MTILDRLLSLFVVPERERLRNLLVPELADLRQQLDQALRLASEAQQRYRRAEEMARAFMNDGTLVTWQSMQAERDKLRENLTLEVKNATRLAAEGDQLRARVAGLEASNHRQGIELSEAREANEALAFDRAKQVNHYNGGLRYRRLSDELIIRDDGYRIEYQLADARNVKPSDWELWAEYKQSNYTGSEIADALMGHKETP